MYRWLPLGRAGVPIGVAFNAADKVDAYDRGCALYGDRCAAIISVLAWEEHLREEQRAARDRPRHPTEPP